MNTNDAGYRHALRRRPLFTPLFAVGALAGLAVLALAWGAYGLLQTPGTVIVVRHAEKAAVPGDDPPLSEAGRRRAEHLAALFAAANVDAIYASGYRRAIETATPLASRLSLPVQTYDAHDSAGLAASLARRHRGQAVLVVGHSNTVPEIVHALSGHEVGELAEDRYGDVFIVVRPKWGRATVTRIYQPAP